MAHAPDIFPPDYATGIGQVRLLIPDTEQLTLVQAEAQEETHQAVLVATAVRA